MSKPPFYIRAPSASFEMQEHEKRNGRPYSIGHRRMYSVPIELLQGAQNLKILEVGAGIGYGLGKMLDAGFVEHYYGIEPNIDSFAMVESVSQKCPQQNVTLWNSDWLSLVRESDSEVPICDYAFCIEVIEHVPAEDVPEFLQAIRSHTRHGLFLSTPDATTSAHGVATREEWKRVLRESGFSVASVARQWTTLYVCESEQIWKSRTCQTIT